MEPVVRLDVAAEAAPTVAIAFELGDPLCDSRLTGEHVGQAMLRPHRQRIEPQGFARHRLGLVAAAA